MARRKRSKKEEIAARAARRRTGALLHGFAPQVFEDKRKKARRKTKLKPGEDLGW